MSFLKKEDILKARVSVVKDYSSKTLGGMVRFKKSSAVLQDAIEANTAKYNVEFVTIDGKEKRNVTRESDLTLYRATCIAYTQVDENDKLIWDGDVDAVSQLPNDVVTELFGFYNDANPKPQDVEEIKEDLKLDPTEPSNSI